MKHVCKVEFSMEMEDGIKMEVSKEMPHTEAKKLMEYVKMEMKGSEYMEAGMNKGMKNG